MKARIYFIAAFALIFQAVEAATVQTDPLNSPANIGDTFTIDIVGIGFPETQGGGFNLAYDASILNITNVSIDEINIWNFVNDFGTIDNVNGILSEVKVSVFPGITGDFIIASIDFIAVGAGTSSLGLTESSGNPWASDGSAINPALVNGSVQVVPVPAAIWLFGSGLLGLVGMARRKKAA